MQKTVTLNLINNLVQKGGKAMKKSLMLFIELLICMGLLLGVHSSAVLAQVSETEEFTLEEITVTAEKREENLQKVAIPVETISGDEVTEMGRTNLEDALSNIAVATIAKKGRELSVSIRGMDDDSFPGDSFSMVSVVVDGTYSNAWGIGQSGLFDMQRVEVLSGPQSTLYSRNSAGGVVNMVSNNPTTERFEGSASIELGNYKTVNTSGMLNVPISDKLALRGAYQTLMHDGYVSNGTNDADFKSSRLKLGYSPTEDMNIILGFDYNSQRGRGQGIGVDPWESDSDTDDPWYSCASSEYFRNERDTSKYYLDFEWDTPIGTLTFLPAYIHMEGRDNNAGHSMGADVNDFSVSGTDDDQEEKSLELRMNSSEDSFIEWIVGLYYYQRVWESWGVDIEDYETDTGNGRINDNEDRAVFGNLTYPVTDIFRLVGGIRYTTDEEVLKSINTTPMFPGQPYLEVDEFDSSHTDYKVGAEYDLSEDTMLWVDYSTGYKHIIRNQQCQTLYSYQLGSKSRFLDQRLQVNATAWYYNYENFDVTVSKFYTALDGEAEMASGTGLGDATLYGLDLTSDFLITPNDRINFSLASMHSEISDVYVTYDVFYEPENVESGGTSLNNAPELSMVLGYQHIFHLINGGSLTAKVSVRYESDKTISFQPSESQYPGFDIDELNYQEASHISEVSLNYIEPNGKWTLNGYCKNIEDYPIKTGLSQCDMRTGDPRTYGAVLSVKF